MKNSKNSCLNIYIQKAKKINTFLTSKANQIFLFNPNSTETFVDHLLKLEIDRCVNQGRIGPRKHRENSRWAGWIGPPG